MWLINDPLQTIVPHFDFPLAATRLEERIQSIYTYGVRRRLAAGEVARLKRHAPLRVVAPALRVSERGLRTLRAPLALGFLPVLAGISARISLIFSLCHRPNCASILPHLCRIDPQFCGLFRSVGANCAVSVHLGA